ncbi:DUF2062 domain-containing protein [Halodurantibacterium flavum]|uniref:DUF2062 domain-containing protein n=1 Tax=Halodurantibacterium flavum TaxID=1382802 RepID=A0ABW4S353_9RHOB
MVFRRRSKRSWGQAVVEFFYPRGGWGRAISYMRHRLGRLPDAPHRIARGIFAGVFVSFTPLFGFHFILAVLIAWAIRGNVIAALISTFFGNPLTFPIIMTVSIELGNWMLGNSGGMPLPQVVAAFARASVEFWHNIQSTFTADVAHWDNLSRFFWRVFLPYLIGGLLPGLICAFGCYYLSLPVIGAYQKRRKKKLRERIDRMRQAISAQDPLLADPAHVEHFPDNLPRKPGAEE